MSRPLGSRNIHSLGAPDTVCLTAEERIEFLASLIVDRIVEDQANGQTLFKNIEVAYATAQLALT